MGDRPILESLILRK